MPVINEATIQRPLHRIAEVRRQQGISKRTAAKRMGTSISQICSREQPHVDMMLSELHRWEQALEVPVSELLVGSDDDPLQHRVVSRARLIKVMKTARALMATDDVRVERLAMMLEEQLCELMPELAGVRAWKTTEEQRMDISDDMPSRMIG